MKPRPNKRGTGPGILPGLTAVLAAALLLLTFYGCGQGMSDLTTNDANAVEKGVNAAEKFVRTQKDKFNSLASSADFKTVAPYAQKENWTQGFTRAEESIARAGSLFDKELAPLMKKNNPQDEVKARIQINRIKKITQEARDQAGAPFNRMDRIRTAMDKTQSIYVSAGDAGRAALEKISTLEQGPVTSAREKFPNSLTQINDRFAPFSRTASDTRSRLAVLEKEYQAFSTSDPVDFAAFIDSADGIENDLTDLGTRIPKMEKDLGLLYQSYTKVLHDMKVEYYVTVKRESWDDTSDSYNPGFTTFTRAVTPSTFQTLTETNVESIADLVPVYGRPSLKNRIGQAWEDLNIHPTENWPNRRHNAATFWVEKTDPAYFHKYTQETNGETRDTDWVKVNPSFYEQNFDNLGMAILSKPYGEFEPDTQAAPPGMAYVGNPEYGEWKTDENGENFWSWYGRYAFFSNLFFFPPYYYHYGSWNRWHKGYRHKKPYYGKAKHGGPIFGTRGSTVKKSPRYQKTSFARAGGFKAGPASVRGGASAFRGGGPKGKGK